MTRKTIDQFLEDMHPRVGFTLLYASSSEYTTTRALQGIILQVVASQSSRQPPAARNDPPLKMATEHRLHISGLTPAVTPADLKERFQRYGNVTAVDTVGPDALGKFVKF